MNFKLQRNNEYCSAMKFKQQGNNEELFRNELQTRKEYSERNNDSSESPTECITRGKYGYTSEDT